MSQITDETKIDGILITASNITSIGEQPILYPYPEFYERNISSLYLRDSSIDQNCLFMQRLNKELDNGPYKETTIYCYSENKPTTTGDYWHYVDGVITIW